MLDNACYQRCAWGQAKADALKIELLFLPAYFPPFESHRALVEVRQKPATLCQDYPDFNSFTTAIERCLQGTRTLHAKAINSLLSLNFQTFQKFHL